MQETAGDHAALLGVGRNLLDPRGLFWAIVRQTVEIRRLPGIGETVVAETWPGPPSRTAYPRYMVGRTPPGRGAVPGGGPVALDGRQHPGHGACPAARHSGAGASPGRRAGQSCGHCPPALRQPGAPPGALFRAGLQRSPVQHQIPQLDGGSAPPPSGTGIMCSPRSTSVT